LITTQKPNFTWQKIVKNFVKVCLHSIYIVQNTFHFDEIFLTAKFKIRILLFEKKKSLKNS